MNTTKKCEELRYRTVRKLAGKWYLIVAFDESWYEVTGPFRTKKMALSA